MPAQKWYKYQPLITKPQKAKNSHFKPHFDVKPKEDMPQFPLRSFDGTRLLMERIPLWNYFYSKSGKNKSNQTTRMQNQRRYWGTPLTSLENPNPNGLNSRGKTALKPLLPTRASPPKELSSGCDSKLSQTSRADHRWTFTDPWQHLLGRGRRRRGSTVERRTFS
jgi:hypothetical protein